MWANGVRSIGAAGLAAAGLAWPSMASALECGEVVSGEAALDRDLVCTTDPALTLADGADLDLGDFAVICDGTELGIVLEGHAGRLEHGVVAGCSTAIKLAGSGGHSVRRVTASGRDQGLLVELGSDDNYILKNAVLQGLNDAAIQVDGAHNTFRYNTVGGSLDQGFEINGNDNLVEHNHITGVAEGVQLEGTGNRVLDNDIAETTDRGIEVRDGAHLIQGNRIVDGAADGIALLDTADGNAVVNNTITGHGDQGLFVATFGNTLTGNLVLLNATDLTDATPDCDDNLWADNTFESSVSDDCVD